MSRAVHFKALPARPVSFDALYEAHVEDVYVWAMRYAAGRTGWAEDVTHDVFLKAWEHQTWLREEDVRGWLFRVTQNVAFSALRREKTFRQRIASFLFPESSTPPESTPDAALERREAVSSATATLDRLPGQERVVMTLKLLDDLSQREIAQLLSLSEGYVSKLISRAQGRLSAWGWKVDDGAP
ncbi:MULTISPECIES: RNA polymerase sigma factor [unclassified Myxococcus]|jgi:RNA polymerase sigma-70 factor (ECF subfamily)|uniref:RNA polymerase sigma factor n=1 Tax=unclassified Myxococcus TaxID=2648731 RepID=UPI001CC093AE|nr:MULTISPECIES: RNA polymerase sigma factor [unclassified Myxococcus]MBZ4399730.1 RNA polymerase sigma factor [Myxococcus sp. AS-1-15]MBZ4409794.1 RNA polymerase sigma factor [Myxococcus sp. XM-1-1-1]